MPTELPNLRDVGGLRAEAGQVVRPGRLLRSALPFPDDVVPDHIVWPPEVVIDLRSAPEIGDGHPLAGHVPRTVNLPLLSALRPERGWAESLPALYGMVLDDASHLLVDVVREVAAVDGPALVHCAAGKDRTGVSVALVLRLLGVDRDAVVEDYLLTDRAREAIDRRLRRDDRHGPVPPSFFETPTEAIELVLDRWDAVDGGAEAWFLGVGGEEALLERLRSSMLG
ncbi:MAG: tyrosine-protein phosphatase [Aeromicrobium erythreum]